MCVFWEDGQNPPSAEGVGGIWKPCQVSRSFRCVSGTCCASHSPGPGHTMADVTVVVLTSLLPSCDASSCLPGPWVKKAPFLSPCVLEKRVSQWLSLPTSPRSEGNFAHPSVQSQVAFLMHFTQDKPHSLGLPNPPHCLWSFAPAAGLWSRIVPRCSPGRKAYVPSAVSQAWSLMALTSAP